MVPRRLREGCRVGAYPPRRAGADRGGGAGPHRGSPLRRRGGRERRDIGRRPRHHRGRHDGRGSDRCLRRPVRRPCRPTRRGEAMTTDTDALTERIAEEMYYSDHPEGRHRNEWPDSVYPDEVYEYRDLAAAVLPIVAAEMRRDAAGEALDRAEHRIARLEAQTDIRGRAVVIYRERAREAEARIADALALCDEWEAFGTRS